LNSRTSAIIVAAGAGTRLSADHPKAFVSLAGAPLFVYSLRRFDAHAAIDELELQVDQLVMETLARYQLAARDLRFVTTAVKIAPPVPIIDRPSESTKL
jgi:2-C-methyl-D-erythritol 4-phosphate cytidylyltransferase